MVQTLEDIEIWEAFKNGDDEAYATMYRENVSVMYRYGMSLSSISEFFVFDCIHDVFTEIWIKRQTLSTPTNTRSYLLKALKNRMQNQILRRENRFLPLNEDDFDGLWEDAISEEKSFIQNYGFSKEELVNKLIDQLPPRQQEALRLRFIEELEYNEVANVMCINRQSAQNLVVRAVEKLRKSLPILSI